MPDRDGGGAGVLCGLGVRGGGGARREAREWGDGAVEGVVVSGLGCWGGGRGEGEGEGRGGYFGGGGREVPLLEVLRRAVLAMVSEVEVDVEVGGGKWMPGVMLMGEKILTVKCDEGSFWVGVGKASFATGLRSTEYTRQIRLLISYVL